MLRKYLSAQRQSQRIHCLQWFLSSGYIRICCEMVFAMTCESLPNVAAPTILQSFAQQQSRGTPDTGSNWYRRAVKKDGLFFSHLIPSVEALLKFRIKYELR